MEQLPPMGEVLDSDSEHLQDDSSSMSIPWGPKAAWIAVFHVPWLRPIIQTKMK